MLELHKPDDGESYRYNRHLVALSTYCDETEIKGGLTNSHSSNQDSGLGETPTNDDCCYVVIL